MAEYDHDVLSNDPLYYVCADDDPDYLALASVSQLSELLWLYPIDDTVKIWHYTPYADPVKATGHIYNGGVDGNDETEVAEPTINTVDINVIGKLRIDDVYYLLYTIIYEKVNPSDEDTDYQ